MLHGQATALEKDNAISKKNKLGILLFIIYMTVYSGFVGIGVIAPHIMKSKILSQNVAVVYGLGLIVLAIIMGVIYNFYCTKFEDQLNIKEDQE
jgi:uncharacterized membrane protein (DUF485 family)